MKKTLFIALAVCLLTACETKYDTAGDFGGHWQQTKFIVDGKSESVQGKIYWSVRSEYLVLNGGDNKGSYGQYALKVQQKPNTLEILQVWWESPTTPGDYDKILNIPEINEKYRIPESGVFNIDKLNSKEMILSSVQGGKKVVHEFRKY